MIRNVESVIGFLQQDVFMRVVPSLWSVGGSVVIILATVAVCFKQYIKEKCNCTKMKEGYRRIEEEKEIP